MQITLSNYCITSVNLLKVTKLQHGKSSPCTLFNIHNTAKQANNYVKLKLYFISRLLFNRLVDIPLTHTLVGLGILLTKFFLLEQEKR